jgi:predicted RND superfamily exporter protein
MKLQIGRQLFIFTFAEYVAHNLCCQIRAHDNSSTCTFTTGKSVTCTGACAIDIYPIDKSRLFTKRKKDVMFLIYICIFMFIVVLFAFTPSCLWEGALLRLFVYFSACWCPTHIVLCFWFALFVMCALCCQFRWIFLLFF